MSSSAIATRPAAPTSTTDALASYLTSALGRIDRAIGAASFSVPADLDADRAARMIAPLAETLAGLAMGTIVSAVSSAVRKSLGAETTQQVAAALATQVARYEPRRLPALAVLDDTPSRSFGEELAKRLRARIALEIAETRRMLAVVADIVASGGPIEVRALNRMLEACAADPLVADKFTRDLERGWAAWCAVLTNARPEQSALWTLWSRRVRGEQEVLTPTTAEVMAAGFIARIG